MTAPSAGDDQQLAAVLEDWTRRVCAELGVDRDAVDVDAVLGLAGVAAHSVIRPAAPLTTYLAGVAVGRALDTGTAPADAVADVLGRARRLAQEAGRDGADDTA